MLPCLSVACADAGSEWAGSAHGTEARDAPTRRRPKEGRHRHLRHVVTERGRMRLVGSHIRRSLEALPWSRVFGIECAVLVEVLQGTRRPPLRSTGGGGGGGGSSSNRFRIRQALMPRLTGAKDYKVNSRPISLARHSGASWHSSGCRAKGDQRQRRGADRVACDSAVQTALDYT